MENAYKIALQQNTLKIETWQVFREITVCKQGKWSPKNISWNRFAINPVISTVCYTSARPFKQCEKTKIISCRKNILSNKLKSTANNLCDKNFVKWTFSQISCTVVHVCFHGFFIRIGFYFFHAVWKNIREISFVTC